MMMRMVDKVIDCPPVGSRMDDNARMRWRFRGKMLAMGARPVMPSPLICLHAERERRSCEHLPARPTGRCTSGCPLLGGLREGRCRRDEHGVRLRIRRLAAPEQPGKQAAPEQPARRPRWPSLRLARVNTISIDGVTTSVSSVAKDRPKTIAEDSEIHHCVDGALIVVSWWKISSPRPKAIGSTPRIADSAVSTTGRARSRQVCSTASDLVPAFLAQPVVGVDQHDVVVHHDAGQRDHADARHHDAEGLAGQQQAEEHADRRHDHAGQHQPDAGELVELRQQHEEDQEDRRAERLAQEVAGVLALPRPRRQASSVCRARSISLIACVDLRPARPPAARRRRHWPARRSCARRRCG